MGQWVRQLWSQVRWRLFVSHLFVAFVAIGVLAAALEIVASSAHVRGLTTFLVGGSPTLSRAAAAAIQQALTRALILTSLVALFATSLISLYTSRRISDPLRAMMDATRRVADGQYSERVPVVDNFEVTQLARSFNQMAATLEQNERHRQTLIADVSHELRTPLTSIRGYLEGLIDGVIPWSPETFTLMHAEASRMERLVEDLQELSRLEAGQMRLQLTDFSLYSFLVALIDEQRPRFERRTIALVGDYPMPAVWIRADRDRLKQIMLNLLSNALHYTPPAGHVRLSLRADSKGVGIHVADSGVGIQPADLPYIFTRFYRVDKSRSRSGGGTGIGLTIARYLAQAHGGDISVTSTRGSGTTFTVHLPAGIVRSAPAVPTLPEAEAMVIDRD